MSRTIETSGASYSMDAYPEEDSCSYQLSDSAKKRRWQRIDQVFGGKGMPSCGMTDAKVLGASDDQESNSAADTIYLK